MENIKKYAVIDKQEFYNSNTKVVMIEKCETREEAIERSEELNDQNYMLSHNQYAGIFKAVEIEDDNANYQTWCDGQDWDGCPIEEPTCEEDNAVNCDWAEQKTIESGIGMYITDDEGEYVCSVIEENDAPEKIEYV